MGLKRAGASSTTWLAPRVPPRSSISSERKAASGLHLGVQVLAHTGTPAHPQPHHGCLAHHHAHLPSAGAVGRGLWPSRGTGTRPHWRASSPPTTWRAPRAPPTFPSSRRRATAGLCLGAQAPPARARWRPHPTSPPLPSSTTWLAPCAPPLSSLSSRRKAAAELHLEEQACARPGSMTPLKHRAVASRAVTLISQLQQAQGRPRCYVFFFSSRCRAASALHLGAQVRPTGARWRTLNYTAGACTALTCHQLTLWGAADGHLGAQAHALTGALAHPQLRGWGPAHHHAHPTAAGVGLRLGSSEGHRHRPQGRVGAPLNHTVGTLRATTIFSQQQARGRCRASSRGAGTCPCGLIGAPQLRGGCVARRHVHLPAAGAGPLLGFSSSGASAPHGHAGAPSTT